jgi:hypothetical protein
MIQLPGICGHSRTLWARDLVRKVDRFIVVNLSDLIHSRPALFGLPEFPKRHARDKEVAPSLALQINRLLRRVRFSLDGSAQFRSAQIISPNELTI